MGILGVNAKILPKQERGSKGKQERATLKRKKTENGPVRLAES